MNVDGLETEEVEGPEVRAEKGPGLGVPGPGPEVLVGKDRPKVQKVVQANVPLTIITDTITIRADIVNDIVLPRQIHRLHLEVEQFLPQHNPDFKTCTTQNYGFISMTENMAMFQLIWLCYKMSGRKGYPT